MQSVVALLRVYANARMLVLLLLGFSSGLPLILLIRPLTAWLTEAGLSKETIGLFTLLGLPYSFKFLWSPFLDRFVPSFPGRLQGSRRRGWMALTQILLCLGIGWLGLQDPNQSWIETLNWPDWLLSWAPIEVWTRPAFLVAMLVAFLSATQDIAADAYRTDLLEEREMGSGVAIFVAGYRVAVLTGGSVALILADFVSWSQVYLLMATLMLIGTITSFLAPEPEQMSAPTSLVEAVVAPFQNFLQQPLVIVTLLFITVYQLPDSLSAPMITPFLLETGFTKTDLGILSSGVGLGATIGGGILGGAIISRLGIVRSLIGFSILQGISNLGFMILAIQGRDLTGLTLVTIIENVSGGMGTAGFLAFLMSLCQQQYSATQYALLSSLFAVGRTVAGSTSGFLAASVDWIWFFGLTSLAFLPGLALIGLIDHQTPSVEPESPQA